MILSTLYELKNPSLSGLCCGKTLLAGTVAIALLGYAFVGAPILGSLLQGNKIVESIELGLGGLLSLMLSGALGIWSGAILDCTTKMNWKSKASIAAGLATSTYLSSPLWLQSPILSISASKIYASNGLGLAVGTAVLVLAEVSACIFKNCRQNLSNTDSNQDDYVAMQV